MDKYEVRRQRLILLRDTKAKGKAANVAKAIERDASYVTRMLYPEGKKGKKRIADDMIELIEKSFSLPKGWLDRPITGDSDQGQEASIDEMTPRQRALLGLFDGLTESQQDEEIRRLEAQKQSNEAIVSELMNKRRA
jgi:HTH-type transcriptional regulator, cell division transcriptional repressor